MEKQNPMWLKVISVIGFAFFVSCHGENKEDAHHLQQATDIHKAMMEIEKQFESQLDSLKSLSHHAVEIRDSLQVIEKDFELWEKNVVEVPGDDSAEAHDHGHEHGHEHHHEKEDLQVTPEQMVEIQKELKSNLEKLLLRLQSIRQLRAHSAGDK
ncbi:MAG: hypothetical protein OXI23_02435 [Gemmatimonadota bacterium]|nr:hypothetical protein [Gemmatimonadota bacterium]